MCGKFSPLKSFESTDFELQDILLIEQRGAGRGRGFITTSRGSGFDDDSVADAVARRTRGILNLLSNPGYRILPDLVVENVKSMVGKIEEALQEDHRDWMSEERSYHWLEILALGQERLIDEYESAASLSEGGN